MAGLFKYASISGISTEIINHKVLPDDPDACTELYDVLEKFFREKAFPIMTRSNVRQLTYNIRPSGRPDSIIEVLYFYEYARMTIYARADILKEFFDDGLDEFDNFMTKMSSEYYEYFDTHYSLGDKYAETVLGDMKCALDLKGDDNNE